MVTLSSGKNGLALSIQVPDPGEQVLRGQIKFGEQVAGTEASVELGLISRKHNAFPMAEPWRCELEAPGTRRAVSPDEEGQAAFELKIPAWMRPFRGQWLEIALVVLMRSKCGTTIRVVVEGAPPPPVPCYRVEGLPVSRALRAPRSPWFFGLFLAATFALILAGFWTSNPELFKGAVGTGILSFVLAFFALPRAWRWIRLGPLDLHAEGPAEKGSGLRVRGRGRRLTGEGKVSLVAREFIYSDSSLTKFEPNFSLECRLNPKGGGAFEAELPGPKPDQAPPSLTLLGPQTQHGILWELEFELETRGGGRGKAQLPLRIVPEDRQV